MNVLDTTLKNNMCIGCGACATVCTQQCIQMEYTAQKEFQPKINMDKCTNCSQCAIFCPHSEEQIQKEHKRYDEDSHPEKIGLVSAQFYHAVSTDKKALMQSTSGGMLTDIICALFDQNMIDTVIHAERIANTSGNVHYQITESYDKYTACQKRGTIYGPLHYDKIISKYKGCNAKILLIGTPCVIRAFRKIFDDYTPYQGNILLTCALCCSHNVNGQFTDFLAEYYGLQNQKYISNMRAKDNEMADCNNFYTLFSDENRKILIKENRFDGPWTYLWRNYFFAMQSCIECRDFWGREADFSLKDAWGSPGANERYGSSILIVRNQKLIPIIEAIKNVKIRKLSEHETLVSQKNTVDWKQLKSYREIEKDKQTYLNNIVRSKKIYSEDSFTEASASILAGTEWENQARNENTSGIYILNQLSNFLKYRYKVIRKRLHAFPFYKENTCNKIVMFGGFAGKNEGDEAQIDETYHLLQKYYPSYMIKILSPVAQHTYAHHDHCPVGDNSRVAIWDEDSQSRSRYSVDSMTEKLCFLVRGIKMVINAWLVRFNLPTVGLTSRQAAFLYEIKTSNLIYFSGGGYLTGDTLSRLWDHLFVMEIANIFRVPYVLSGHNIGLWDCEFTRKFAAREFSRAKAITLRDPKASIDALREIGVSGKHIFAMFDDALFCNKVENPSDFLQKIGIQDQKYIVFNMHYWGADTTDDKRKLMKRLQTFLRIVYEKTDYEVVLLPSASADVEPLCRFYKENESARLHLIANYDSEEYDFRMIRGIIAKAQICITMKHHPIIFAMGECVPTIALSYRKYYVMKNQGALGMFSMEKYNVNIVSTDAIDTFRHCLSDIQENSDQIRLEIQRALEEKKRKRDYFLSLVDQYIR